MKISLITVCHNQLHHTKRFIDSLRRFTPKDPHFWELVVIDAGSTDGTFETFQDEFKTVGLENVGWVEGINEGLTWIDSEADIVIFANNDIVLQEGWIEKLVKHFEDPTVGAVGPTSNYVMGRQHERFNQPHLVAEPVNFLIGFFFAVRKSIVDEIGGLDETLSPGGIGGGDDLDYSIRIRKLDYRLIIARDIFIWHAGSQTFLDVLGPEGYNQHWRACDERVKKKWGELEFNRLHAAPLKFAIGVPLRGWHPHWKFSRAFAMLKKPPQWDLLDSPRGIVDQSRNAIVQKALEVGGFSHLLFLDDDHEFGNDLFYKLISHNKDVVGALAFRRLPPFSPCVFSWSTNRENGKLVVVEHPDWIKTGLRKVDAMGFSAVLLNMRIFEKLGPPPWFKFGEVGEDLTFFDCCAQKGIEVHCDTDLIAPHINDEGVACDENTFYEHHKWSVAQRRAAIA